MGRLGAENMTVIFQHDEFFPGDERGFGMWRAEHYFEHNQFNLLSRDLSTPFVIPEYDIYSWDDRSEERRLWLLGHYDMHLALREATGITGIDLGEVDWEDPLQQAIWLLNHASEHEVLREVFGVTA